MWHYELLCKLAGHNAISFGILEGPRVMRSLLTGHTITQPEPGNADVSG